MLQPLKSKCCQAGINLHQGDEGTNCYICSKCKKGCDPMSKYDDPLYRSDFDKFVEEYSCQACEMAASGEHTCGQDKSVILKGERRRIIEQIRQQEEALANVRFEEYKNSLREVVLKYKCGKHKKLLDLIK